jgi:hypothetical protein
MPTMILTIFFCNVNTFLLSGEFPPKLFHTSLKSESRLGSYVLFSQNTEIWRKCLSRFLLHKVEVKLFLNLINHYAMKIYRGMEV